MSSTNGPRDSLSDYEFSFEAYLDYTTGIEVDVSLIRKPWPSFHRMLTFHSQILGVVPRCQLSALDRQRISFSGLMYRRDTASVAESIYEFHKENGRTYHAYRAGCTFCSHVSSHAQ